MRGRAGGFHGNWRLPGRRYALLLMAALAAIALVAAACGDDDEVAEVGVVVEESDEGLKIGFLADFSGPLAEFGPETQTGVELAVKHINDAGGVLGQDVTFVTGDSQVDETIGVEEARRLVDIEGVHAIIGPLSSTVTLAVAESVTGLAGVPTISPSATSPAISVANDNGFLFRSTTSDAAQGVILAQLAADEGIDNIAVIFRNDAYGQGLAEVFEASFGGTTSSASYEPDQVSYLAELQQIAGGGAAVLVAIGFPGEAIIFLRESIENDIFTEFLFVDGTKSEDMIAAIGAEFLDGSKGTAPVAGPETDALRAWNDAYTAEFGELPTRPFVREAYDAMICIALAAEFADSTDGTAIRDALPKVCAPGGETVIPGAEGIAAGLAAVRDGNDINYDGAATSLDWDDVGDVTSGFVGIWQYQGGAIVELDEIPFSLE